MSEDLETAISRCKAGRADAFERIVREFERPLRAWLAALAPPGADVDEMAQRSFVAAYNRLADYEAGSNFPAWLFTIARYQLRTEANRLKRIADYHSRYAPDLLLRELERRETKPPEAISERLRLLETCLARLGENLRQFVAWRYEEEISLEEMAKRTGRSVAAVKKQLWKLRQKLHDCILERMKQPNGETL